MVNFIIREAKLDDAYWIAYVNIHTSYSAYKWLMPEEHLINRIDTIKEFSEKMRKVIENWTKHLVVEDLEIHKIIWILGYWPSRNENYPDSWEIIALYVLPEYQKLGIGKKLFLAWIDELINLWYNTMIINILEWNNAIDFYKKYWGTVVWERYDQFSKVILREFILFFEDIKSIK